MPATLATLPVLWLDQRFDVSFGPFLDDAGAALSLTGHAILLSITNQTTGVRVELTGSDATLSSATVSGVPVADAVASFVKPSSWVAANLTAGWLELLFFADEDEKGACRRLAVTPTGGRVSP